MHWVIIMSEWRRASQESPKDYEIVIIMPHFGFAQYSHGEYKGHGGLMATTGDSGVFERVKYWLPFSALPRPKPFIEDFQKLCKSFNENT